MGKQSIGVTPPRALAIGGTDSGGGAGISADLRTFTVCGVHGSLAVCAITAQNSLGVFDVHAIPPQLVAAQVAVVADDIGIDAAKTGMLANAEIIAAVAEVCDDHEIGAAARIPLVVDPVMASMHDHPLLAASAIDSFRTLMFPRATVVTPNLDEVRLLVGIDVHDRASQHEAALALHGLGPEYVLVKGGHLEEDADSCVDLLYDGVTFVELPGPRFDTGHTHGGGDSMAAAITSGLAQGMRPPEAVALGKRYIIEAVRHAYPLGAGHGPVSPLWAIGRWWEQAADLFPARRTATLRYRG